MTRSFMFGAGQCVDGIGAGAAGCARPAASGAGVFGVLLGASGVGAVLGALFVGDDARARFNEAVSCALLQS
jgi:hypothetical protein